jgi:4-methylaminobutanoate oxidase (formaldehyde-forming)
MGGVQILEETKVTGFNKKNGRVTGVVTNRVDIESGYFVNCDGIWAREIGKMAGVNVPIHAAEHYYLITDPIEGMHSDLRIVEEPDQFVYYREEIGGLMLGLFEPVAGPWGMGGIPEGFSFGEISPD